MAEVEGKRTLQEIKPEINRSLKYLTECKKYDTKEALRHFEVISKHTAPNTGVCDDEDALRKYIGGSGICEFYPKMLGAFLAYLEAKKRDSTAGSQGFQAFTKFMRIFVNLTYLSPDCGYAVAKCGSISLLFQALETIKSTGYRDHNIDSIFVRIFSTLNNVIRVCPSTMGYYRDCDVVSILKGYLQLDMTWQLFSLVILAYVATDSEKKELAETEIGVSFLMKILGEAVGAYYSHAATVGPVGRPVTFSAFEVLDAINHLAVNDDVKITVGRYEGGISSIVRMLQDDFSPDEQRVATEALWNLAFIESIRESDILQDTIPMLKELAKSQDRELRRTSASTLFEIQGGITTDAPSPSRTTPRTPPPSYQEAISEPDQSSTNRSVQIMISYQWDIKERAIEINKKLLAAGYKVWIDVKDMRGDILGAMAKAVETSDVILYCMTERYKDSKSCRSEAVYARKLNKKMIPLLLQQKYNPDGWLGILQGEDLYYKFYPELRENEVQNSMVELLTAIKEEIPSEDPTDGPTVAGNEAATPERTPSKQSAEQWSKEQVQRWLKDKNLTQLCEKFKDFNGRHLKKKYEKCCRDEDKFEESMMLNYNLDDAACTNFIVSLQDAFDE